MEQFRTLTAAADYLQVHPQTLRLWVRTGRITAVKFGPRTIRFRESDLTEFLERHASRAKT